jgi:hypothetical protein
MSVYKKFCYWVDPRGLEKVRMDLEVKSIQLTEEVRIPCRVLKESIEIGYVTYSAWDGFCKRRTSWYWKSKKAERFLIVSNTPLNLQGFENPIVIAESNFSPDRFPIPEEMPKLIQSKEYQKKKPRIWDQVDPLEKEFYKRWFERNRIKEPFDFDQILLSHSANHANFLDPGYFVNLNGVKVPYSINDSIHVCSSCLEFFNILGEQWPVKYVVPCIGAVQFAHLPMDQYFEVRIQRENGINKNKG